MKSVSFKEWGEKYGFLLIITAATPKDSFLKIAPRGRVSAFLGAFKILRAAVTLSTRII